MYSPSDGKVCTFLENPDILFTDEYLRSVSNKVIECGEDRLFLNITDLTIKFALMSWHTEDDENIYYDCVFQGEGYGGSLREMRHIWWGEDGYTFYLPGNSVIAALTALKDYFDF